MKKISCIIPCYNSALTIKSVICEIEKTISLKPSYDFEIILINDCSKDCTYKTIQDVCKGNNKIKGINLSRNFGQHSAIMAGFRFVTGDIVVCLDDDGQTPANEMFNLIEKLDEGYDAVFAKYKNKKHSLFRNFGSKVNDIMAEKLINKPKNIKLMSYFACKRFVIDEIKNYYNPYPYIGGLVLRTTNNIINVEVNHRNRIEGESGYNIRKLIGLWINGFTAFSVKPLRIATAIGILFSILGFIYIIYVIFKKVLNPEVPIGWSSLISFQLLIGGITLFMLGLIGEYIGRIYISINNSPQYVIKETINVDGESKDE